MTTLTRREAAKIHVPLPKKGQRVLVGRHWLLNEGASKFSLQPVTALDKLDQGFETYAGVLVIFRVPEAHTEAFERGVMQMGYTPVQMESEEEHMDFHFNPGWFSGATGARGYFGQWLLSTKNTADQIKLVLPNTERGKQLFDEWTSYNFGISCYADSAYILNWFGEIQHKAYAQALNK